MLRIAVGDSLNVPVAERKVFQKRARLRHRAVGIIDREHDSPCADFGEQVGEGRWKIEAPEGVVNILAEIVAYRAMEFGHDHMPEGLKRERKGPYDKDLGRKQQSQVPVKP